MKNSNREIDRLKAEIQEMKEKDVTKTAMDARQDKDSAEIERLSALFEESQRYSINALDTLQQRYDSLFDPDP